MSLSKRRQYEIYEAVCGVIFNTRVELAQRKMDSPDVQDMLMKMEHKAGEVAVEVAMSGKKKSVR